MLFFLSLNVDVFHIYYSFYILYDLFFYLNISFSNQFDSLLFNFIILYYNILYYILIDSIISYYTISNHIQLYHTISYYIVLYSIILYNIIFNHITINYLLIHNITIYTILIHFIQVDILLTIGQDSDLIKKNFSLIKAVPFYLIKMENYCTDFATQGF